MERGRHLPSPLEATSVAIKIGDFPERNSEKISGYRVNRNPATDEMHSPPNTHSRSCCCLSPWIHMAGQLQEQPTCTNMKWLLPVRQLHTQITLQVNLSTTHPSRRSLRVSSSTFLFVSTNTIVCGGHTSTYIDKHSLGHMLKSIIRDKKTHLVVLLTHYVLK